MECRQALSLGTTFSIKPPELWTACEHLCFFSIFCATPSKGLGPVHGLLETGCTAGSEQRANQLRLYLQLLPMAHITSWAQGNKLRAPSDSRYGELYNYFILVVSQCNTNRNKMHNKCNALESP